MELHQPWAKVTNDGGHLDGRQCPLLAAMNRHQANAVEPANAILSVLPLWWNGNLGAKVEVTSKGSVLPMPEQQIRFDDGASYERMMGVWSTLAGDVFLDWLKPRPGLRWIDIGCGNGAFTELIVKRFAPAEVHGIDPSEAQLDFARTRPGTRTAKFQLGDAMALPFSNSSFDVAVMALVIFFVPDPAKGVAEMARVVRPGGEVAAYVWDIIGGKGAAAPIESEMRAMGLTPLRPPSFEASRIEALQQLWSDASLVAIETREIEVQRTFDDFDDFWTTTLLMPSLRPTFATMPPKDAEFLRTRVRARLPADGSGRITYGARANAVKGRMPA